jgi:hypothetical protein
MMKDMPSSEADSRRLLNDDRWRRFEESGKRIAFVCECDDPGCFAAVVLTGAEFRAARARPPHLLLKQGHSFGSR